MAHAPQPSNDTYPEDLLHRHVEGWHAFTKATKYACVALVVFLAFMLVFWAVY